MPRLSLVPSMLRLGLVLHQRLLVFFRVKSLNANQNEFIVARLA